MTKESYLEDFAKVIEKEVASVDKANGFMRDLENRYNAEAENIEEVIKIQEAILRINSFVNSKEENIVSLRRQYEEAKGENWEHEE